MKGRLELGVTALVAVGAFAVLAVTGTTPTGVLAAGVLLVSAVGERRSLSWVLLAVALLLIGPASAVLAAAALSPRHPGDDLKHQGVAALRRIISAGLNPAVAAGAAFGAYRRGGRNEEMWWLIGWLPTMLASGLSFALWHSFEPVDATIGVGFAGAFLSLSQGPHVRAPAALAKPVEAEVPVPAGGRTVVATEGAEMDWSKVVAAPEALTGRPPKPEVAIPNDAASIEEVEPQVNESGPA